MQVIANETPASPPVFSYAGRGLPGKSGYAPELDTFRALAILSVMCLHWLSPNSLFNRVQGQTTNGVHLFFVLSGFLITRILLQCRINVEQQAATRAFSLRQFYARRFLRIFPVYYFVLAIGVLLRFQGLREGVVWHAAYLSNFYFYSHAFDGPASPFWTLAVEEQFYLIWPLAILFLPRRAIFPFVALIAIAGTAIRVEALLTDTWLRILTPACMNFLAMGSLVAVAESPLTGSEKFRRNLLRSFGVLIAVLACCSAALIIKLGVHHALESFVMKAFNQPMMSMVYACIFAWAGSGGTGVAGSILRFRPLVYLGRISYGVYIYHLFVSFGLLRAQHWLAQHLGAKMSAHLVNNFGARFAITIAIASASWHFFEKPINDMKRHFPYR